MTEASTFANKTYLVTGGAGFIGSHTVRALLDRGASVIVVDEFNDFYDPAIKEANVAAFANHPRFHLYRQDIREFIGLRDIFERHGGALRNGGIIHLAARAGVRPSLKEPRLYLETNVTGTLNLAELAREFGIQKFVFASSSSVYGDSTGGGRSQDGGGLTNPMPFREDQDISKPISPYASTKAMGESLLHTYSHLYGLQVVALRFFTVYGAGQRPDLAIHKFTRLIDEGKPIPVFGDGSTRRDYTYIDDIIQGVMAAVAYESTPYEIFNLGESQTTELSILIALIEESLGKKAIIDRQPMQPGDVSVTYADISKARQLLGYNPTTKIPEGIPRFVEWYRSWNEVTRPVLSV
jgi:UDP-glucuronate 4-epimerase